MSTNYPQGSMGQQDQKNQKLAAVIFILGFLAIHAAAIFIPAAPHFTGINYAVTGVAVLALIILVALLWGNADLTEEQKWPHILVIVLAFASAVMIGYCPTC